LLIAALLSSIVLTAACGGGADEEAFTGTEGRGGADRYLRLFEVADSGSSLFVHERALPPTLAEMLNPGLTDDTPDEDVVALLVHPDGVLLGSYHVRRRDGTNEIWIMFDVPGGDAEVAAAVQQQMDETPWQVTGGQSNELISAVLFQSTVSGEIDGFVAAQALPSTPTFSVTVERDGERVELELARGASSPELDLRYRELVEGLEVTEVLSEVAFEEGDLIVAVGDRRGVAGVRLGWWAAAGCGAGRAAGARVVLAGRRHDRGGVVRGARGGAGGSGRRGAAGGGVGSSGRAGIQFGRCAAVRERCVRRGADRDRPGGGRGDGDVSGG